MTMTDRIAELKAKYGACTANHPEDDRCAWMRHDYEALEDAMTGQTAPRYGVVTDTEDGHPIGYTVWDMHEDHLIRRGWLSEWSRHDAELLAERLNAGHESPLNMGFGLPLFGFATPSSTPYWGGAVIPITPAQFARLTHDPEVWHDDETTLTMDCIGCGIDLYAAGVEHETTARATADIWFDGQRWLYGGTTRYLDLEEHLGYRCGACLHPLTPQQETIIAAQGGPQ